MKAKGGISQNAWDSLQRIYKELDYFVNLVGLAYDADEDCYVCNNADQVDPEWCDDEMLASLENAHADLEYFLR